MFNALGSLDAIEEARVLDLFAGTGALGIEALSRGAAHATFVEHDARAREAIVTNLAATGLAERGRVEALDATQALASTTAGASTADLVLLDPPYAYDEWDALLAPLAASMQEGYVVIESDRALDLPEAWEVVRSKWYGTTLVVIARVPEAAPD